MNVDKLPANPEAERLVLGCVILDNGLAPQVLHELSNDDFSSASNRYVFSAMRELDRRNRRIDPLTVIEELTLANVINDVGGPAYVSHLFDGVPRFSVLTEYVRVIRECSLRRKAMKLANWIMVEAQSDDRRFEDLIEAANRQVEELHNHAQVNDLVGASDAVDRTMRQVEERWRTGQDIIGLSTGFDDLDRHLLGLRGGKYYVIAAAPGMGKTTLALNIADRITSDRRDGQRVGLVISLEMPVEELTIKMIATRTKLDTYGIETGRMHESERQLVREAAENLKKSVLLDFVEGFGRVTAQGLIARVNKVKQRHGRIDFLVIDYLQLLDTDSAKDSEYLKISEISRTIKRICVQANIPVIVLSQLNRKYADRTDKDYRLADLRGSGSIEQDADVVLFLMPEDWTSEDDPRRRLKIAKHRGGRKDVTINLVLFGDQSRFESAPAEGADPVYAKNRKSSDNSKQQLDDYYSYM